MQKGVAICNIIDINKMYRSGLSRNGLLLKGKTNEKGYSNQHLYTRGNI